MMDDGARALGRRRASCQPPTKGGVGADSSGVKKEDGTGESGTVAMQWEWRVASGKDNGKLQIHTLLRVKVLH